MYTTTSPLLPSLGLASSLESILPTISAVSSQTFVDANLRAGTVGEQDLELGVAPLSGLGDAEEGLRRALSGLTPAKKEPHLAPQFQQSGAFMRGTSWLSTARGRR